MDRANDLDLTKVYKQSIKKYHQILTKDEEIALAKEIERGSEEAVEKMILHNLRLVIFIASRYTKRSAHLTMEDLVQEGYFGLRRAVEKFDYKRGYKFSTYASRWIIQSITRSINKKTRGIYVPMHIAELGRRINKTTRKLAQKLGRKPELSEIAREARIKEEAIEFALKSTLPESSLDDEKTKHAWKYIRSRIENPLKGAENLEKREIIKELMSGLDTRERKVVTLRFGLDGTEQTLEEVGKSFSLSFKRIQQIEQLALLKMQRATMRKGYDAKYFSFLLSSSS